jgi:ATP-dependent exoDNAse (exonuclease V) beta subunit
MMARPPTNASAKSPPNFAPKSAPSPITSTSPSPTSAAGSPPQLLPRSCLALATTISKTSTSKSSATSFAIQDGDKILSGAIDRIVLIRRAGQLLAADILDFKTDELPASDSAALATRTDFYRPQLEAYRRAVAKLLRLKPEHIGARIVFLNSGIVNAIA